MGILSNLQQHQHVPELLQSRLQPAAAMSSDEVLVIGQAFRHQTTASQSVNRHQEPAAIAGMLICSTIETRAEGWLTILGGGGPHTATNGPELLSAVGATKSEVVLVLAAVSMQVRLACHYRGTSAAQPPSFAIIASAGEGTRFIASVLRGSLMRVLLAPAMSTASWRSEN